MNTSAPKRLAYTIPEATLLTSTGRTTLYKAIRAGELPVIRIGRAVRLSASALEDWLAAHTEQAGRGQR